MRRTLPAVILLATAATAVVSQASLRARHGVYMSYDMARKVLESGSEILPPELKGSPAGIASSWPAWVESQDRRIRSRLVQGEEDSLVNFMLFGTSFTKSPRITLNLLAEYAAGKKTPQAREARESIESRAADLIQGVASPGNNERLAFARQLLRSQGIDLASSAARAKAKEYLLANLVRILSEQKGYARVLEQARQQGGTSEEFIERSHLFKDRGLSSDTSLMPDFAIEESLKELRGRGFLSPRGVRRVAIIGPGLDFTDKEDGYDFYPEQTTQPFAVVDSLIRLGLADESNLQVTTMDLSDRVNNHLDRAHEAAQRGIGYVVQLPLDSERPWTPGAVDYWSRFGEKIGTPVSAIKAPLALGSLKLRAVKIDPKFVSKVSPTDVNIVVQRLDLTGAERFDVIVATNILVYYDLFEQSLALANICSMLRPGGILLSNDALLELPGSGMKSVGYKGTAYSTRPGDGDNIVWYQRASGG
ncbi:MAG TPA: class I SAM-dependent methyltransferase [Blastocatellia bacterium]|nr:class I SAM-dependent methyltransferase [Blastocatellia bacterium]